MQWKEWRTFLVSGLGEPQQLWHLGPFRFFWLQQLSGRASNGFTRGPSAAWPAASCVANSNETVAEENTLLHWLNQKVVKKPPWYPSLFSGSEANNHHPRRLTKSHSSFHANRKEAAAAGIWRRLKMMCRKKKSWRSSRRVSLVLFVNKQKEGQTNLRGSVFNLTCVWRGCRPITSRSRRPWQSSLKSLSL